MAEEEGMLCHYLFLSWGISVLLHSDCYVAPSVLRPLDSDWNGTSGCPGPPACSGGLLRCHDYRSLWVSRTHNSAPNFAPSCAYPWLVLFLREPSCSAWLLGGRHGTAGLPITSSSMWLILHHLTKSVFLLYPLCRWGLEQLRNVPRLQLKSAARHTPTATWLRAGLWTGLDVCVQWRRWCPPRRAASGSKRADRCDWLETEWGTARGLRKSSFRCQCATKLRGFALQLVEKNRRASSNTSHRWHPDLLICSPLRSSDDISRYPGGEDVITATFKILHNRGRGRRRAPRRKAKAWSGRG